MTDLTDAYAEHQRLRGFSAATITRRTSTLHAFARTVALEAATESDVAAFLAHWPHARTRHAYLSDLRAFYGWAVPRGHVAADPTTLVGAVKVPNSLPRPVRGAQAATRTGNDDVRLMAALALYAGLRCCEIARLHMDDVTDHEMVVRGGKGGKDRQVRLHPALARMLAGREGPLFPGLSPGAVSKRLGRHMRACGVPGTAHQLRHTFGTELARVTPDLLMIGQVMGHSSATTTLGYTMLASDKAAGAMAAMFPDGT